MGTFIRKKKKTLFGRIVRKIESEFSTRKERIAFPDIPIGDTCSNGADVMEIQSRRDELKSAKHDNSDVIVTFDGKT